MMAIAHSATTTPDIIPDSPIRGVNVIVIVKSKAMPIASYRILSSGLPEAINMPLVVLRTATPGTQIHMSRTIVAVLPYCGPKMYGKIGASAKRSIAAPAPYTAALNVIRRGSVVGSLSSLCATRKSLGNAATIMELIGTVAALMMRDATEKAPAALSDMSVGAKVLSSSAAALLVTFNAAKLAAARSSLARGGRQQVGAGHGWSSVLIAMAIAIPVAMP